MTSNSCECGNCARSKEFRKHIETVVDRDTKIFFENLFGYLYEIEEDIECQNIYLKNLKTLYPRIYKEITTLEILHRDNAEYPEEQL
jgi:hypothetical protein